MHITGLQNPSKLASILVLSFSFQFMPGFLLMSERGDQILRTSLIRTASCERAMWMVRGCKVMMLMKFGLLLFLAGGYVSRHYAQRSRLRNLRG